MSHEFTCKFVHVQNKKAERNYVRLLYFISLSHLWYRAKFDQGVDIGLLLAANRLFKNFLNLKLRFMLMANGYSMNALVGRN